MQGPNVKKLIIRKMSLLMVPASTPKGKGMEMAVNALRKPGNIGATAREATAWVEAALEAVRSAPDNPYGDDDEAIAGEILRQIEEKKIQGNPIP